MQLKPIGIGYFVFGHVMVLLSLLWKISIFPITLGILAFLIYFLVQSIRSLFASKQEGWALNFLIFWALAVVLSMQLILVLTSLFQGFILAFSIGVLALLLFLAYRYRRETQLSFLVWVLLVTTGTFGLSF
ncbi:MAG: hypothetical protein NBV61_02135 [Algoriphagus sp.]|nr:hypothetical protein [Algoriphagus sp.]